MDGLEDDSHTRPKAAHIMNTGFALMVKSILMWQSLASSYWTGVAQSAMAELIEVLQVPRVGKSTFCNGSVWYSLNAKCNSF